MTANQLMAVAGACAFVLAARAAVGQTPPLDATEVVDRFVNTEVEPLTSYGAWRTLEASARSMRARLVAWTTLDASGRFRFEIVEEEGSSLIRNRVLRAALEAEQAIAASGEGARGALTRDNYTFGPVAQGEDGVIRIGLTPRRSDRLLLTGTLHLTQDTVDVLRIEGRLVKRPSFWTRRVDVTRTYSRVAGVRVPLRLDSVASVLVAGTSVFSMVYEYESVNGRPVGGQHALRTSVEHAGP